MFLVIVVSVFLFSVANAAIIVERSANASATNQNLFAVDLSITPVDTSKYDIAELFPVGWSLSDWHVSGNETSVTFEQQQTIYQGSQVQMFHWNFSDNNHVLLKYEVRSTPGIVGQAKLISVVVYPGGFDTNTYLLVVKEGGIVEQIVSVQPIIEFKEFSTLIVAGILVCFVMILTYYLWKSKKKPLAEAKLLVLPVKPVAVQKQEKPAAVAQRPTAPAQRPEAVPPRPTAVAQRPTAPAMQELTLPPLPAIPRTAIKAAAPQKAVSVPPTKPRQVKKPSKKKKPTKFYSDTLKKLERIEKNLKK